MSHLNLIEAFWIAAMLLAFPKVRSLPHLLSHRVRPQAPRRIHRG